ncbi:hypothetical protein [Paenibacillus wynnii]|uniref:hypothetical protein n=1 Tax=Paenibacillus wynnii TaxID=268407 RepID=UPI002790EFFC|nr:hypothetical protein [Paenibacillus wynnii]MDQ0195835.1 hypothetical protein [Paenibacillus wynnii]
MFTKEQLKSFIQENDIKTAGDIQNALKNLFADTLQEVLFHNRTGTISNALAFMYRNYMNYSKIENEQESIFSTFDSLRDNYFISTQSRDNVLAALYTFGPLKRSFQVKPIIKIIHEETKAGYAFLEGDQLLSVDENQLIQQKNT